MTKIIGKELKGFELFLNAAVIEPIETPKVFLRLDSSLLHYICWPYFIMKMVFLYIHRDYDFTDLVNDAKIPGDSMTYKSKFHHRKHKSQGSI